MDKGVRLHGASPNIEKYFNLEIYNKGREDEHLLVWRERTDVIDREIALCGCFVLITSEDMTVEEAINLYKSRDVSEKLFRGDKSYMGAGHWGQTSLCFIGRNQWNMLPKG